MLYDLGRMQVMSRRSENIVMVGILIVVGVVGLFVVTTIIRLFAKVVAFAWGW